MIISKNTKIFLIIFSVLLLLITISTIVYVNTHKNSNESQIIIENADKMQASVIENIDTSVDTVKGVSLDDTYSNNEITYTYIDDKQNDINIRYPIISGLKDKSIEESINTQIRERINEILNSNNFKNNSDSSAYVNAYVVGNFADVLSVKIYVKFTDSFSKEYGVNYKLRSGDRIKLDEVFTKTAPKKNIITASAYKTFAINYYYTKEGLANEFYTNIESDIFKFITEYNNNKITQFSFTPMYIELYRDGKTVRIKMEDYAEYIAIYNRFKSEDNLYETTGRVANKIPVFTKRPDAMIDLYEKVNSSCMIDVCLIKDKDEKEFSEKERNVIENYKKELISERLKNIKTEKGIYYSNYVTISRKKEDGKNILVFSEDEKVAKTSEEKFKEIYDRILGAERDINNEDYEGSRISILPENIMDMMVTERKYDIETGEEIKEDEPQPEEPQEGSETNEGEQITEASPSTTPGETPDVPQTSPTPAVTPNVPSPSPANTGDITTQVTF